MKIILMILITLSLVKADEMDRIEAIVDDITQLRSDYETCQNELNSIDDLNGSNVNLYKKIRKLEKQLLIKNNLLKSKDKTIKKLKLNQEYSRNCTNKNDFPKLLMKKEFKNNIKITKFKAASFELKIDSIIYDDIDGKKIDEWVKTTSFTSNIKTATWMKVSGYFIDKKWRPAKADMWIKIEQVFKK